jgi:cytochrome c-type biogenesis protein CcmH
MDFMFFGTALMMIVIALSFAATPLVIAYERNNAGFARFPLLAIIVVIGFAIGLYAAIGKPGLESQTHSAGESAMAPAPARSATARDRAASVETLLTGLEERLSANPDDGKGWLLLAKSYDHLGRDADAAEAYAKAAALGVTDDTLAARLNSDNSASSGAAEIRGRLSYAQSVADQIDPGDVVFITAKAEGNPMPLAVLRRSASELPFDFVLSDEASMVKGSGISTASEIVVTAKVSKSGDALKTDDDLQATAGPVDPDSADFLELVIGAAATTTERQ